MEKTNDLFATLLYQPNLSLEDLNSLNITPDNTGLKSKDDYKNIKAVQEFFTNNEGNFDEKAYSNFYDSVLGVYNDYIDKKLTEKIANNYTYDPFDWRYNDKVTDVSSAISLDKNPMGNSTNIRGIGINTDSQLSMREIAQTNRVFDYESGEWLDWTPNDQGGLFKWVSRPSLVLATYDDDGTHEENGRTVYHHKGDYKIDPITGKPFYETVGNREIYDKDVLHATDTLTREGTKINKYDFFDSDGLDKSIGGTIMKLTVSLAPAFVGLALPEVGMLYGGVSALISLGQLMPTLGKAINGFVTNDNDNDIGRGLTNAEAWVARFGRSSSDKSREKMVSFENAAGLIKDVSLQLFQQRAVSYIPRLFKNNPKIYNNEKLARGLAYAYMSGTSSMETYSAFKQAGADDRVAGIGMLATMGAFYKLMSIDYFRDSLFKGSWFDDNNVKSDVWRVAEDFMKVIESEGGTAAAVGTKEASARTLKRLTSTIIDGIKRQGKSFRPSTFMERSFAEGAEEVMEEAFQDAIKATFKGAEALGIPMNEQRESLDFGFSPSDFAQRYGMSLVGGLVGGALFQSYGSIEQRINNIGAAKVSADHKDHLNELVKLIADGRGNEIKQVLSKWHKAERFGSNDLSGTKLRTISSIDGDKTVATPNEGISQNDLIYQILCDEVDYVEKVLEEEGFKNFESLGIRLADKNGLNLTDSQMATIKMEELGLHTLIYDDLNRLATDITYLRGKVDSLRASHKPASDTAEAKLAAEEEIKNDAKLKDYENRLKEFRKQRDDIKDGKWDDYYVSQYRLILKSNPIRPFLGFSDLKSFVKARYDVGIEELTEGQREIAEYEYNQYINGDKKDVFRAIDVYRTMSEDYADEITKLEPILANVVADEELATSIQGNQYFSLLKSRTDVQNEINTLNEKSEHTEEENQKIKDLEIKVLEYNRKIEELRNNPQRILFNLTSKEDTLIEKLTKKLNAFSTRTYLQSKHERTAEENAQLTALDAELDSVAIDSLVKEVTSAYEHFANKKVLKRSHAELNSLYQLISNLAPNSKQIADTFYTFISDEMDSDINPFGLLGAETEVGKNVILNLDSFYKNLFAGDDAAAIEAYDEAVRLMKENGLSEDQINILMFTGNQNIPNPLMVHIGEESLPNFIRKILNLKGMIPASSLTDLLKGITSKLGDSAVMNVFDLLESEQKRVIGLSTLDAYTMSDYMRSSLTTALQVLNAIKGIVVGASDGTNQEINKYRKDKKKYAEISKEAAEIISTELDEMMSRIAFLLKLHDTNSGLKLREHKEISKNMHLAFLDKIKFHSDALNDLFKKEGLGELNIENLLSKHGLDNLDSITSDNFNTKEAAFIAFETDVYNTVQALGFTDTEITDKIISLFGEGSKIWAQKSTRFGSNPDVVISDYDFAFNLLTIMTLNANDFYVRFRDTTKEFEKEPTYGHEYVVRLAYAMMRNVGIFNRMAELIASKYGGTDEYIKQRRKLFNIIFALGGAGVGKSTSIARTFLKMIEGLDNSVVIMSTGPDQIKNLQNGLGSKGDTSITYSEFFSKAFPNLLSKDNLELNDDQIITKSSISTNDYEIHDSKKLNKIFICDEIETLNEIELEALSKYCQDYGIFCLGLGDNKQPGGKIIYDDHAYESGIEDCISIKGPYLMTSLRTLSQAKNDNANVLETLIDGVQQQIYDDYEKYINVGERDNYLAKLISNSKPALVYAETADRIVGDEITTDKTRFEKQLDLAIERAKDAKAKVLLVYDDSTKSRYQADKYQHNDNVILKNANQALGGEFMYAFVDIEADPTNLFGELQQLYMLTQRSQLYTCVLDSKKFWSDKIKSESVPSASAILSMDKPDLDEFKSWRLSSLNSLVKSENYDSNMNLIEVGTTEEEPIKKHEEEEEESPERDDEESPAEKPAEPTAERVEHYETRRRSVPPTPVEEHPDVEESESEESEETPEKVSEDEETPISSSEETPEEDSVITRSRRSRSRGRKTFSSPTIVVETPTGNFSENDKKVVEKVFAGTETTSNTKQFSTEHDDNRSFGKVTLDSFYNNVNSDEFYNEQKSQTTSKRSLRSLLPSNISRSQYTKDIIGISSRMLSARTQADGFKAVINYLRKYPSVAKYLNGNKVVRFTPNGSNSDITIEFMLDKNESLVIPIGQIKGIYRGIYSGTFNRKSDCYFEKGERISLTSLIQKYPGLSFCSQGGIFIGEAAEGLKIDKDFIERNDGKAFLAVGEGVSTLEWDDIFSATMSNGSNWAFSHSDVLKLIAFQKTMSEDKLKLGLAIQYVAKVQNQRWDTSDKNKLYHATLNWLSKFKNPEGASLYVDGSNLTEAAHDLAAEIFNNNDWKLENYKTLGTDGYSKINRDSLATVSNSGIILANILGHLANNPSAFNNQSYNNTWYQLRRWLSHDGVDMRRLYITSGDSVYYIEGSRIDTGNKQEWKWQIFRNETGEKLGEVNGNGLGNHMGTRLKELFDAAGINPFESRMMFTYSKDGQTWWRQTLDDQFFTFLFPIFDNTDVWNAIFNDLPHGFFANVKAISKTKDCWKKTEDVNSTDLFTTDASIWHYSTYNIDENAFASGDTETKQIESQDRIKEFEGHKQALRVLAKRILKSDVIDEILDLKKYDFKSYADVVTTIKELIDEVNEEIMNQTKKQKTKLFAWDDEFGQIIETDNETELDAIANAFNSIGVSFVENSVPTKNETLNLYIFKKDINGVDAFAWFENGEVHVLQTNVMDAYDDILNVASIIRLSGDPFGTTLFDFIRGVIKGTVSNNTINAITKIPNQEFAMIDKRTGNKVVINWLEKICNFLERRLENHEC